MKCKKLLNGVFFIITVSKKAIKRNVPSKNLPKQICKNLSFKYCIDKFCFCKIYLIDVFIGQFLNLIYI